MAKEGIVYLSASVVFALCGFFFHPALGGFFIGAALFVIYFFRDPRIIINRDDNSILSPADGVIREINTVRESEHLNMEVKRIIIFLSLFNVHINRSPVKGTIKKSVYLKGAFHPAFTDKACRENERNTLVIGNNKISVVVRQIAGLLTRRIVTKVQPGDFIDQGERFGMIIFGSCVEIDLPTESQIRVKKGDKIQAGQTVLAVLE